MWNEKTMTIEKESPEEIGNQLALKYFHQIVPNPAIKELSGLIADAIRKERESHCKDCCCSRVWKALGVTGYTGKAIPEHIEELLQAAKELAEAFNEVAGRGHNARYCGCNHMYETWLLSNRQKEIATKALSKFKAVVGD